MERCLLFAALLLLAGCNAAGGDEPTKVDGYQVAKVPGVKGLKRLEKKNNQQAVIEEGFVENGKRTGTWVFYDKDGNFPEKVISYMEGKRNGLYMEFNERGALVLKASYRNDKLHGPWAQFQLNRPVKQANYVDGELDGIYREFYMTNGRLHKLISYKNGVQNGPFRVYDERGQLTLEYQYKDGEKVEGGIVNESATE